MVTSSIEVRAVVIVGGTWSWSSVDRTCLLEGQSMVADPKDQAAPGSVAAMVQAAGPCGSILSLSIDGISTRHEIGQGELAWLVKTVGSAQACALIIAAELVPERGSP